MKNKRKITIVTEAEIPQKLEGFDMTVLKQKAEGVK